MPVAPDAQEALGRTPHQRRLGKLQVGGEGSGVDLAQGGVEIHPIALEQRLEALGQTSLVDVPRRDLLADGLHRLRVPCTAEPAAGASGTAGGGRLGRLRPGGSWELPIPPHRAFGVAVNPPVIGPHETLLGTVKLVAVRRQD